MGTKIKRFLTLAVIAIMLLSVAVGLLGCNTFNLEKYKEEAKTEIDSYAQAKYRGENWTGIQNIVANKKTAINEATNKVQVNSIVVAAKRAIDRVEEVRFKPMFGAEEYAGGNGTESTPYIISTKGQLIHFSNQINSGINLSAYFVLGADIDLEGIEWMPIGIITENYNGGNCFRGFFDGKGYEISNFCITTRQKNTDAENIGLFGYNAGIIRNLGVVNFTIDITWAYEFGYVWSLMTGGLAGSNCGDITNCFTIGEINLAYYGGATITSPSHINAGGLVGYNNIKGNISNCFSAVEVSVECSNEAGTVYVGGLAGVTDGEVVNCFVTGNVNVDYSYHTVGGKSRADALFGKPSITVEQNCYWYEGLMINGAAKSNSDATCSATELGSQAFYINNLGWNAEDWNLGNLYFYAGKFINGKYPKLIQK